MSRVWSISEVISEVFTPYQHVLIAGTAHGITLFCDDERQSTEASQLVYHEALLVPALLLADQLSRVLVIGSSEGVVSQLALAAGAERVDHVDIDAVAVRACADHLPYGYTPAGLDAAEHGSGPVAVHYTDGWDFLAEVSARGERYDVIVVDLPDEHADGEAQHNRLYSTEFLARCAEALAPGGVLTSQAGCPTLWRNETLLRSWRRFTGMFGTVVYFGSDEHEWAFLSGRLDTLDDPVATMTARLAGARYQPSSMDAETLRGRTVPPHSLTCSAP
ncbi:MAG: spermidine synthase [Haloechinothrix sp.]